MTPPTTPLPESSHLERLSSGGNLLTSGWMNHTRPPLLTTRGQPSSGEDFKLMRNVLKLTKGGERHNYRRAVQLKRLPSQATNSSSGSGSKKLSSSFIRPFMEPNSRLPCFWTRTIRATGVPLRAMTTSSPGLNFRKQAQ